AGWCGSAVVVGSGWLPMSQLTGAGDADGDGHADLLAVSSTTGQGLLYPGLGDGHFAPPRSLGTGWNATDQMVGTGDLDGDGHLDLVVREIGTGKMRRYFGRGERTCAALLTGGAGWNALSRVMVGVGVTGDGHPDLMAVNG